VKVSKYRNRDAGRKALLIDEQERTEAEANVRRYFPDALHIAVHPYADRLYAEVHVKGGAQIVRVPG
jgi:hypothetical protein